MINQSHFIKPLVVAMTIGGLSVGCANVDKIRKEAQQEARASFEAEKAQFNAEKEALQQQLVDQQDQLAYKEDRIRQLENELAEEDLSKTPQGAFVWFETDKAVLRPQAERELEKVATFLQQNPTHDVLVVGHTDSRGTEEYNMGLSERRAEAVRSALIQLGVADNRILMTAAGESKPIADNSTPEGLQQNRRVKITILNEGESMP